MLETFTLLSLFVCFVGGLVVVLLRTFSKGLNKSSVRLPVTAGTGWED